MIVIRAISHSLDENNTRNVPSILGERNATEREGFEPDDGSFTKGQTGFSEIGTPRLRVWTARIRTSSVFALLVVD